MTDDLLNSQLGPYELKSLLGKGGMAAVYLARQKSMDRDVAIKVMAKELADDEQFVQRFEHEAQLIAKLQHPHILPVIDFGREGNYIYIVMQVVRGGSLDDRLRKGPLSLNLANRMLGQIASALGFAHEHGIVHRDLKPNNVLLDEKDNAYLTDFGIAKMVAGTSKLTATGNILGTPAYMAPEQWRGEPVDARTDIYSLGIMLYEMVLGRLPFSGETPYTLMYKHFNDPPPMPRQFNPNLNPAIEAVILKALSKNADERYQSADEMAADFDNAVRGLPLNVRQTPPEMTMDKTIVGDDLTPSSLGTVPPTMPPGTPPGMPQMPTPAGISAPMPTPTPTPLPAAPPIRKGLSPVLIGVVALIVLGLLGGGAFLIFGNPDDDDDKGEGTPVAQATNTETPEPTPEPTDTETAEPSPSPTERLTMAIIVAEQSTVRSGPGSDYTTLGVLPRDEQVVINAISEDNEWYQIVFQGDLGWIWSETVRVTGNPNIPVKPWPSVTPLPTSTPEPTTTPTPEPTTTPTPEPTNTPQPPSPTPQEVSVAADPAIFVPTEFTRMELPNSGITLEYPSNWDAPASLSIIHTISPRSDDSGSLYPQIVISRGTPQEIQSFGVTSDITSPVAAVEHTLGADFTGLSAPVDNFNYPAYAIDETGLDMRSLIWLIEISSDDWLSIVALVPEGEYTESFRSDVLDRMITSMEIDGQSLVASTSAVTTDTNLLNAIPIQLGSPILDRFDNNDNDWRFGSVLNGQLVLDATSLDRVFWSFPATVTNAGPAFYYQVTGELIRTPTAWEYGVIFRAQDEPSNFYYYVIDSSGQYTLFSVTEGTFQEILGPNNSDVINLDGAARNTLGVLVLGDYIELYINNQRVNSVVDNSQQMGNLRVTAYTPPDADQTVAVAFDDFAYLPLTITANDALNNESTATIATVTTQADIHALPQTDAEVITTLNADSLLIAFGRTPDNNYLFVYGNNTVGWTESAGLELMRAGTAADIESLPAVAPSLSGLRVQVWPVIWPEQQTTTTTPLPTPTFMSAVNVSLAYGGTVTGTLNGAGATTTWTFAGQEGDVIRLTVVIPESSPNLDVALSVSTADGEIVVADDDSGLGVNPLIENFTLPANGVYTIEASSISGDGTFTLELEKTG